MPLLIAGLIVQFLFAGHAYRSGRPLWWVSLILLAPLLGVLAYVLFELVPEWRSSFRAQRIEARLAAALRGDRVLRARLEALRQADTPENRRLLAEECLRRNMPDQAVDLYEGALVGPCAQDPALLMGLARARFARADYAGALAALDRIAAGNPDHATREGRLLHARSLEMLGRTEEAMAQYEALSAFYPGPEPRVRYGLLLQQRGEPERARALFAGAVASYGPRRAILSAEERELLDMARRCLG